VIYLKGEILALNYDIKHLYLMTYINNFKDEKTF
jgi:hypothetical protein